MNEVREEEKYDCKGVIRGARVGGAIICFIP